MDAAVGIAPADRAGLERLLRYCARPPLAMERLHKRGADLVYHCPKPQSGAKQGDLILTPLELIDRIAAPHPPTPLLRRAGTQLTAPSGGEGHGTGATAG